MPFDTTLLGETRNDPESLAAMTERLPGLVFQFYRSDGGQSRFPFLAGNSIIFGDTAERGRLAEDARHAFDHVHPDDFHRLMVAVERSAKTLSLLAVQFRLCRPEGDEYWIAARAQPEPLGTGTLWHGLMLDISEQVAHQVRLQELSDTDSLTGLPNRRKLMSRLNHELSLSSRHGTPLSLMLLDLDLFKRINDTWGHLEGDRVLSQLAELCQGLVREEDMLARLGGEEFAILLPLTVLSGCRPLAERLRQRIADHDFGLPRGSVTVSIGIAEYRVGEHSDALIERADRRLYAAKGQGRDRVVFDD